MHAVQIMVQIICTWTFLASYAHALSNSYSPYSIECPGKKLLRPADSILPEEWQYLRDRRTQMNEALTGFLQRSGIDIDVREFMSRNTGGINIGQAFSGGGFRAMLTGAGSLAALDNRTPGSTEPGQLGGLFQASSYMTGLSGGSWLIASLCFNNLPTTGDLLATDNVWNLENGIIAEGGINIFQNLNEWSSILRDVTQKKLAGFPVSITDIWGRALSRQLIGLEDGGPGVQWSDMQNAQWFQNREAPYPLIVIDDIPDGANEGPTLQTGTSFEVSPYELGSFDSTLNSFVDIRYLGTDISNNNGQMCTSGLDNIGFVFGTSSSVFNKAVKRVVGMLGPGIITGMLGDLVQNILSQTGLSYGAYRPNPFQGSRTPCVNCVSSVTTDNTLKLVDGGEDGQVIPFQPLLHKERKVDVIFAYDNNDDTTGNWDIVPNFNWPTGSSVVDTFTRTQERSSGKFSFPSVPKHPNTFLNLGLTASPTFFGCTDEDTPLIVYLANYPYSFYGNTSTFKLQYSAAETIGMVNNGYNLATQLNGTRDSEWPACVACAVIQRANQRDGKSPSEQCQRCFQKYCWSGSENNSDDPSMSQFYNPPLLVNNDVLL